MANQISKETLQQIIDVVSKHPEGISAPKISSALLNSVARRTLQYRLKYLVGNHQLRMDGIGRWAKYRVANETAHVGATVGQEREDYDQIIGLSDFGKAVRDYVRQPTALRIPVGYHRDFLGQYEPNTSAYLTKAERERLAGIGKLQRPAQPAGTYAKLVLNRLLIDLAWNSSRLEGNTYSLLDTKRLIEFGKEAEGRDHIDAQMILNHKDAIEFLVGSADEIGFNTYTILNLHALLSNNLLTDPAAVGRLRFIAVGIEKSVFHPLEMPQLIEECFSELLTKAAAIDNPYEQAFFVMAHLPYLQPFDDVNKRVSRLAANIPMIRNNLAPLSFTDVPQRAYTEAILGVYELNDIALLKDVFIWAYQRSAAQYAAVRQSLGEPDPFRLKYRTEIRDLITMLIRRQAGRKQVGAEITSWSENNITLDDQKAFSRVVEEELIGLHEGNFARYLVRPSEFAAWQEVWAVK